MRMLHKEKLIRNPALFAERRQTLLQIKRFLESNSPQIARQALTH
jgi:hypothetical protein